MDNRELMARYDQLLTEYERARKNILAMREKLAALNAAVESKDGMVKVGVGSRGELRSLEFNPRVYRRLTPTELAETVLETVAQAGAKLSEKAAEIYAPYLPAGTSYEDLLKPDANLSAFVPAQPVTNETFDEWWAQFKGLAGRQ